MGTRGGLSVVHIFPADGQYALQAAAVPHTPIGALFGLTTLGRADRSVRSTAGGWPLLDSRSADERNGAARHDAAERRPSR